ncbi:MAG: DUF167 family protein [Siculibacillus sp.]|nr:DUF167 family protein [Siculibacillus sp.]
MSAPVDPRGAVRVETGGVRVQARLTPKASRDAVGRLERLSDGSEVLVVHVRAVPSEGAANTALVRLFAEELGVAKSKVELVAGRTSRVKTLRIAGDGEDLARRLAALAAKAE